MSQKTGETVEDRLQALGFALPDAPRPVANYVPSLISGDMLFISGQIAKDSQGQIMTGILGHRDGAGAPILSVADGQAAAKLCALNILAQIKAALGTFDRVAQVVRLTGFVASTADFTEQPAVINGASDLMVAALGDRGRHTRAAVGVASLPAGTAVEIDAMVRITL